MTTVISLAHSKEENQDSLLKRVASHCTL